MLLALADAEHFLDSLLTHTDVEFVSCVDRLEEQILG
jgi:hypothetical protein